MSAIGYPRPRAPARRTSPSAGGRTSAWAQASPGPRSAASSRSSSRVFRTSRSVAPCDVCDRAPSTASSRCRSDSHRSTRIERPPRGEAHATASCFPARCVASGHALLTAAPVHAEGFVHVRAGLAFSASTRTSTWTRFCERTTPRSGYPSASEAIPSSPRSRCLAPGFPIGPAYPGPRNSASVVSAGSGKHGFLSRGEGPCVNEP